MILCYEGTPGSGKSLDAVVKIIDNLRLGRVVYTNISGIDDETCLEHIKIKTGMDDYEIKTHLFYLPDNKIVHPSNYSKSALIVIDEVHKLINARNWNKGSKDGKDNVNQVWADWASTHRHGGYDVVLITQNLEKVDGQVRGLVEFTHRYKKNNYFGSLFESKYLVRVYEEDSKKIIGKRFGTYDVSYFKCYKSYAAGDIKEQKIQANVNILKHPIFFAIPVLLAFTIYMFTKSSFASGDLFGAQGRLSKSDPSKKNTAVSSKQGVNSGQKESVGGIYQEQKLDSKRKPIGKPVIYELNSSNEWVKKDIVNKKPDKLVKSVKLVSPSVPGMPDRFFNPASRRPGMRGMPFNSMMVQNDNFQGPVVSMVAENVVKLSGSGYACSGDECYSIVNGEVVAVKR